MTRVPVRRALLSASDKRGLEDLARRLVSAGVEILASGGTAEVLAGAGIRVTAVEDLTRFPEILGGRVKTLHPRIHGGLLADRDSVDHARDLVEHGIDPIDLVVVDLYPFPERPDVETIDIGGVALLRAAAKNHPWVGAVSSPDQYVAVAEAVETGGLDDTLRRDLSAAAFRRTADYDAAIAAWLEGDELQETLSLQLRLERPIRYGENPHQAGAAYLVAGEPRPWWASARQLQGKELSYNNLLDADSAWALAAEFSAPAAVVVKHAIPCGAAESESASGAWAGAWAGDPESAFGGVAALNRPLEEAVARRMAEVFLEVVVAPRVAPAALELLARRRNLRVLEAPARSEARMDVRSLGTGLLVQDPDRVGDDGWRTVAGKPTSEDLSELRFAWAVAAHARSNAVVVARGREAVGVGAGDQSRVGAARRAVSKAGERARGAVAAGDAFFPFRDGLDVLAEAGVRAVVAPGGSLRDDEVVEAARELGLALIFSGRRHFRH